MIRKRPPKVFIHTTEFNGLSSPVQVGQVSAWAGSIEPDRCASVCDICSTVNAMTKRESPKIQAIPTQRSRCFLQPIIIEASVVGKTAINIHKWKSLSTKKVVWIKGTATIKTGTIKQWIAQTTAILMARWSSQACEYFFDSAIFSDIKIRKEPLYNNLSTPVSTLTDGQR